MARFVNILPRKCLGTYKTTCGGTNDRTIAEYDYMVFIEDDKGRLLQYPSIDGLLFPFTADEFLEEATRAEVRLLEPIGWLIKRDITEWIMNVECDCTDENDIVTDIVRCTCDVVYLLAKYGMWDYEYAKSIDVKKLMDEYYGEK